MKAPGFETIRAASSNIYFDPLARHEFERLLPLEEARSKQRAANRDRGGNPQAQQRRRASTGAGRARWRRPRRRRRDDETNRSNNRTHIELSFTAPASRFNSFTIDPEK